MGFRGSGGEMGGCLNQDTNDLSAQPFLLHPAAVKSAPKQNISD